MEPEKKIMEKKVSPKRLLVDVSVDIHSKIKARAALRNISLKAYVEKAVLYFISREDQYEKEPE